MSATTTAPAQTVNGSFTLPFSGRAYELELDAGWVDANNIRASVGRVADGARESPSTPTADPSATVLRAPAGAARLGANHGEVAAVVLYYCRKSAAEATGNSAGGERNSIAMRPQKFFKNVLFRA
ncbi:hypothetical protein [Arthrobacter psychrolactophilus]|uniref:hypothetical protein n=1 Tax=Arthrobacter psychrolactophilus TaxID=92442 RepID=UPI0011B3C7EE|nr:hypothetical protein [Arthrobacter psychrolactophilus]